MKRTQTTLSLSLAVFFLTLNLSNGEDIKPLQPVWNETTTVQLAKGGTVTFQPSVNPAYGGHVASAIHIDATSEEIWNIVARPERGPEYLGGSIQSCEILEESEGRQLVSTLTKFPWLPIEWNYVYETKHDDAKTTVRFVYQRGNLRHFEGHWRLYDGAKLGLKGGTVVFYEVYLDPGKLVPKVLVRRNLKGDVPNVLVHLRGYVGRLQAEEGKKLATADSAPGA